jgi:NIMA-interacting peptidyl-prolyl cis-trans isomerase 1
MRPTLAASFALSFTLAACGNSPPPPAPANPDPPPAPAPSVSASTGPSAAAVEACLAAAGSKRARFSGEPARVGIKHVLVKYKGAKNAKEDITRTREQACLRTIEARDKIRGGVDFGEVVKEYSEEAGAATRDGSMGTLERKELVKPFADAVFELSVNQISDVVETEFGFHIILRTE